MRKLEYALGAVVLLLGCLAILWPGVLTRPGLNETVLASEGALEAIEGFLNLSDGTEEDGSAFALGPETAASGIGSEDPAGAGEGSDYLAVFPEDKVQRLDLIISAEDWEAMLTEASSAGVGERMPVEGGVLEGQPFGVPPEGDPMQATMNEAFVEACAGCQEGDEITFSQPFGEITGTCVRVGDDLVFEPDEGFNAGLRGGMRPPEDMRPGGLRPPGEGEFAQADGPEPGGVPRDMMVNETADASLSDVECTVVFQGEAWEHVGVRFKGNSTLRSTVSTGSWKYPLHLDFDEYEDAYPETTNQRFYGFDDLSLSNGATDSSLLRDLLPGEILRAFGVPTPEMAYYQVYVDIGDGPMFLGVYTVIETPDDPFLETYFGSSDGNLYKPQGSGATWAAFDEASFEKKSNQDEEDWSDVEEAFEALHASREDAAAWREDLEAVFDVDGFLRWLAITRLLGNWDAYGQMAQNYYLYSDPSDGLIHWIPWDLNQSLNSKMERGATSIDPTTVSDQWPLISYLLEDPVYFDVYTGYVADALATVYQLQLLDGRVSELQEMLLPSLVDEEGNLSEYSFLTSVEEMQRAGEGLVAEIERRIAEAEAFLEEQAYEPAAVVISEIHYNPSPDQGQDERYEFVELINRSSATVDLSGYRFDDGIYYTFPEGTTLSAGACLILAKDAAQYATAACQVLQWERGSLSNGGEILRLVDADGSWIDRVAYGDDAPWPEGCDGDGSSLFLASPETPNHLVASWAASTEFGGTPGVIPSGTQ